MTAGFKLIREISLPFESNQEWVSAIDNSGTKMMIFNSNSFKVEIKEKFIINEGREVYKEQKLVTS
jgi:hypothetical protein